MSRTYANLILALARGITIGLRPNRRALTHAMVSAAIAPTIKIETPVGPLFFHGPTARALHDPRDLFSNEPETIRWIDAIPSEDVLWDVGANVGTFAIYAAKCRGLRVLAFEPSAATYAVLVRNIELNGLAEMIDAYCLAFSDVTRLGHLFMARTEAGHSMHAFGQACTVDGAFEPKFRQSVPGFTIDEFHELFSPPAPQHVKLDVDSIEEKILRGGQKVISENVRTLLVEVAGRNSRGAGAAIRDVVSSLGFEEKREAGPTTRNAIFVRAAPELPSRRTP